MLEPDAPTLLLDRSASGDDHAAARLFDVVYDELRGLASGYLSDERAGHTLQPTALVHEAFVRLIDQTAVGWDERTYFFGVAARTMRRVLVDHARGKNRLKRGGGAARSGMPLDELARRDTAGPDLLELDEALTRLEAISPRRARVVELRYFAGMDIETTGQVIGISPATVKREWDSARAWLRLQLGEAGDA